MFEPETFENAKERGKRKEVIFITLCEFHASN